MTCSRPQRKVSRLRTEPRTSGTGVNCNIVMPAFGFWDSDLVTCGLKKLVCNLLELLIGSLEINLGDEQCFCWSLED